MSRRFFLVMFCCSFVILVGCSESNVREEGGVEANQEVNEEKTDEPVTLTFMTDYPEELLNEEWIEPWEEKFPHVSIEQVQVQSVNREGVEEMVAQAIFPDIAFFHNSTGIKIFEDLEMTFDLNDLVEETGFDLSVINQSFLDVMHGYNDGKLLALPLTGMGWVTYYNKNIFDEFGVPYPEDHMTWSEILDLGRELTREKDGTSYRGLDIGGEGWATRQWSVAMTDPETDAPLFTTEEGYLQTFNMLEELFSIPGNYSGDPDQLNGFWIPFVADQNIAMVVSNEDTKGLQRTEGLDNDSWDIVTWPQFDDRPGYIPMADGNYMGISRFTEHQELIFDMITYLVSEEHQKFLAGKGYVPVVDSPSVIANFGSELGLEDKNTDAIFSLEHAPPPPPRRENAEFDLPNLDEIVGKGIERLLLREGDVQTILREMQDEAEGAIAEAKGAN